MNYMIIMTNKWYTSECDVIDGFVVGKSRQMSCYPQTTHGVADSKL
jgi:hypothetical protein